ncbi:DUF5685 family protein [Pseudoflavonifractor sp. MSJ-37]|uniref:DUF5685 family protein n=1 Tax=Pseudoflavonifractor sp. MSJ-37 TaxID=2841531 RepID=UPI001C0F4B58|nr:DUF5685 family protein [Pseudoflavonifractor sp. MSJ-37]MBU5434797.1 hypothetical protein [Pseudoflavonifractor sp. MSJ-37]
MFGYVRPLRRELKVWEWEHYRAAYCGLCDTIGRQYGLTARMFLNYDFTFLAMLLLPAEERTELYRCRCPARLWCGRKPCTKPAPGMDTAAGESVILTYWKLRDGILDGTFPERIGCRCLSRLLRPAYRKAAARWPEFTETVEHCLDELHDLERDGCPSLDRTADTFARLLQAAAPISGGEVRDRSMDQLLYHVGRWIYLIDALDDLEEDRSSGSYNPLLLRFPDGPERHREEIELTLRHSRNLAAGACALLELGDWRGIIENILFLGLPAVERSVSDRDGRRRDHPFKHRRMER